MIELHELGRTYRVGDSLVHALAGVDLRIEDGEYVSLMGPSGSGKSTLLHVIGLLDRPTAGRYLLDGKDTGELDELDVARLRREHFGFVFQFFQLVPRLTAAENVELPLMLAGVPLRERRRRAAARLEELGLQTRAGHRPDELSGGQRQRVAIARATVTEARVLLADEPTGNLDRATGHDVMATLEGLHDRGMTLIVVTHDPELAERAQRRIRLDDGHVVGDERGGQ